MKPEQTGGKKKKSYLVGREVVKLFQSIVNMMLYIENLKKNIHINTKELKTKTKTELKVKP